MFLIHQSMNKLLGDAFYYSAAGRRKVLKSVSVGLRLCVCPRAYLRNHTSELHFRFRFVDDVTIPMLGPTAACHYRCI